jgi:mevalonate kinase
MVADTGIESPTGDVVESVRVAHERQRAVYDSLFWEIGSMASVAREIIRSGSPEELGLSMSRSHQVLQRLGVSCPELDRLVEMATEKGALGAKLSGAGRGGTMIALLSEDADEASLEADLGMAGAERVYTTVLSADGRT